MLGRGRVLKRGEENVKNYEPCKGAMNVPLPCTTLSIEREGLHRSSANGLRTIVYPASSRSSSPCAIPTREPQVVTSTRECRLSRQSPMPSSRSMATVPGMLISPGRFEGVQKLKIVCVSVPRLGRKAGGLSESTLYHWRDAVICIQPKQFKIYGVPPEA